MVMAASSGEASSDPPDQIGTPAALAPNVIGAGGAFAQRIEIALPEFRNLPLPVALTYNSSDTSRAGVDKLVAFGWGLQGFSAIERKSLGKGVPSFDDGQDVYLLDGEELMACAGALATNPWPLYYPLRYLTDRASASCSSGGNLSARIEDFRRITYDTANNSFTVTSPDGVKLFYTSVGTLAGDTSTAGTPERDYALKARWLLTRIEDSQSTPNVVTYTYAFTAKADGYAPRPTRIDYAGYRVEFSYRDYPANAIPKFATGTSLAGRQLHQLQSIQIFEGTTPIRAYKLVHSTSALTQTQLLASVTEYDANFTATGPDITGGSALPSTTFEYSADTVSFFKATPENTPSLVGKEFHQNSTVLDLDQDGADELLLRAVPLKYISGYTGSNSTIPVYSTYFTYSAGLFKFDRQRHAIVLQTPGFTDCVKYTTDPQKVSPPVQVFGGPYALGSDRTGSEHCIYRRTWSKRTGSGPGESFEYYTSIQTRMIDAQGTLVDSFSATNSSERLHALGNFDLDPSEELRFPDSIAQIDDGDIGTLISARSIALSVSSGSPLRIVDFTGDGVDDLIGTTFRRSLPEPGQFSGAMRGIGYSGSLSISSSVLNAWKTYHPSGTFTSMPGDLLGYADMNGDGLTDVVYHNHNGSGNDSLVYFPSTGVGFGTGVTVPLPGNYLTKTRGISSSTSTQPPRRGGHNTALTDINADGILDLVIHDGFPERSEFTKLTPYSSGSSWILLGTGDGYVQVPIQGSLSGFPGLVAVGDFDGDGLSDIALEGPNVSTGSQYFTSSGSILFSDGGIPNRMISVKSTAGGVITVAYAPSSDFGTNQMPGVQQVVKSITTDDGRGGLSTVEYRYVGGRYDFIARQTLGYKTVTAYWPALPGESEGPQVVTTYLNDHLAEYGLVKSRVITQDGVTLSREIFDYTIEKTGNGPWRADRTSERSAELYGTSLIETMLTRAYDGFGQIIRETSLGFTNGGANLDPSDDVTVSMGYVPNISAYIVDRPIFRKEEAGLIPTAALTDDLSYVAFSYDGAVSGTTAPTFGNLTKIEEWTGNTAALTLRTAKLLSHDAWGNVLTETDAKAAAAGAGPTVTYTYDTTKRLFRLTTTNALGHVETVAWNTLCQAPATITDPNLRATTKTYDTFCRETRTDLPGGQYLITRYVSFGTPTLQHIERETKSGSTTPGRDLAVSREYFDGLGRTWAVTQPGTTSAIADAILQLSAYDPRGNLAWASLPLPFSSLNTTPNAAQRTSFTYDGLDRPIGTVLPDGAKRSLAYLTVSLSHYGGPTLAYPATRASDEHCFDATGANTICGEATQITDAAGRLIRADRNDTALTDMDAGSATLRSTSYRYDLKGSLIAVTDPGGIAFAYTYDIYGNRLTADDPGLGFWTLTYDTNNNLLTQTDAKGQLISFAYDALNRVTLKTVGTGPARVETRFTYDEARAGFYNKGKETTQEVWTPTATTHKVERDWHLMGGLAIERHLIDGRTYALETSFAPNGAPLDQKLPGTPGATSTGWIGPFTYDAAGRVTAFTGYITSVSYNAWGQPTNAAYANGVSEVYAYDPSRGWLTSVTGTLPGGDMAFRAGYDRSATGRIFRADTQAMVGGSPTDLGGSYDYAYDYTGRLLSATNWRGATGFDQVFAYDRAGRIRLKGPTLATATSYAYTDPLTPDHAPSAVTSAGVTTPFTYDANGNMLTGLAGKIMSYDGENRPLSVTHLGKRTCYVYGVDGKRLKKVENLAPAQDCTALPATTPATVYFGAVEVRNWLISGSEQVLTYPHPAVKFLNGTTPAAATYLHRDGLASVRAITDAAGVKVEAALYKPFGEQSEWLLPGNAAPETKGWIGERYDADAGLQYLNARYYDPELALFLQPDWFEVTKAGVGTNRFSYSFNDPVNKMDPGGNETVFVGGAGDDGDYKEDMEKIMEERKMKNARTTDPSVTVGVFDSKGKLGLGNMLMDAIAVIGMNQDMIEEEGMSIIIRDPQLSPKFPKDDQYNLVGYSWGSVVVAQQAIAEALNGVVVDNLVLIGAPINQSLLDRVNSMENIKTVTVMNIESQGDPIYAGMTDTEIISSVPTLVDQMADSSGHFYYSPSGAEGHARRVELVQKLLDLGLK